MTTTVLKVARSGGGDVRTPHCAPAPGGGFYVTSYGGDTLYADFARIESNATITWQKRIDLTSATVDLGLRHIASSTTHVALLLAYDDPDTFAPTTAVLLYDSSGTLVWSVAFEDIVYNFATAASLTVAPSTQDVYFAGVVGGADTMLVKLAGADGTVSWAVNLRASSITTSSNQSGAVCLLSGGDLALYGRGPIHTDGTAQSYVQRCSSTDGSVVWSKTVAWPLNGSSVLGLAVDESDNIYAWSRSFYDPTYAQMAIVKFDSSGATTWNRQIQAPAAHQSRFLDFTTIQRGFADGSGVHIPVYYGPDSTDSLLKGGHVFIGAAGTIGAGNVTLTAFSNEEESAVAPVTSGGIGSAALFCYEDSVGPGFTDDICLLVKSPAAAGDDMSYGAQLRQTYFFDTEAGATTIGTASYTRASAATVTTATARTVTAGTGTLTALTYTIPNTATGIAPTGAFGTPRRANYVIQNPYTPSTVFGSAARVTNTFATSVAPATAFGTPVLDLDLTGVATGIAPTTRFGLAWSERSPPPEPHASIGADPATRFGTPVRAGALQCVASGFTSTLFGTPIMGAGFAASGFSSTAFGTPTMAFRGAAAGIAPTTAFGTPRRAGYWVASGLASTVRFGTPVADLNTTWAASGFSSTAFGTPSALRGSHRARSGVFRTKWGVASAERTAP